MPERPGEQPPAVNWAMHFGQAAVLGVVRSIMAQVGVRGPLASAKFTVMRVTNHHILENATGVGAPPTTWPRAELVVDVLHKTVYGLPPASSPTLSPHGAVPGPGNTTPPCAQDAAPTSARCPPTDA